MTPLKRRQNTSCDSCRRSKRRCFYSPSIGDAAGGAACANCKRLGHSCTFFAASKSNSQRRSRQQNQYEASSLSTWDELGALNQGSHGVTNILGAEQLSPSLNDIDMDPNYRINNNDTYSQGEADLFDGLIASPFHVETTPGRQNEIQLSPAAERRRIQTPLLGFPRYSIGKSPLSPIRLLNSKLDASIIDERLAHIHNTIVTGCASRFIVFDCNLFATKSRYQLEDEDRQSLWGRTSNQFTPFLNDTLPLPIGQSESGGDETLQRPLPDNPGGQMTMIGIVRFLDHFSDLYGNRLQVSSRKQSDAVLKAVIRAFSMQ